MDTAAKNLAIVVAGTARSVRAFSMAEGGAEGDDSMFFQSLNLLDVGGRAGGHDDAFGDGKPTAQANAEFGQSSWRRGEGVRPALPVAESAAESTLAIPWFKHDRAEEVAMFAAAYIKVARAHAS